MAPRREPEGVPVPDTGFATRGGLRAVLPERVYSELARSRLTAPGHPTGAAGPAPGFPVYPGFTPSPHAQPEGCRPGPRMWCSDSDRAYE